MDLMFLVYAISLLGPLDGALTFVNVTILIVLALGGFFSIVSAVDYEGAFWVWFKAKLAWLIVSFCLIGFIKVLIPTEKTAYMMVGAYVTQKIAQDPKVEQVGSKVLTILNQKLDSYIDDGIAEAKQVAEKKTAKELEKLKK